jgi:cyclic pyranopterin phosphate synthase
MVLQDRYQRPITYLRVSVTDRCNLRCVYCMPSDGIQLRSHDDILSFEEVARVVHAAVGLGIRTVRLTGGEPLARKGLVDLVRMLRDISGLEELSLTTNGTLLSAQALALARAGLDRVNVSLDTLRPERFARITRRGNLADVLAGIMAAENAELTPIKINAVVMRGVNDDEVVELARQTLEHSWHVRFIEPMPLGSDVLWEPDRCVLATEIRAEIEMALGPLAATEKLPGSGPARTYQLMNALGTIGFISPWSQHFCSACNRLRLTADGKLRSCLLSDGEIDLRLPLRQKAGDVELQRLIQRAVEWKPMGHHLAELGGPLGRAMSEIGG